MLASGVEDPAFWVEFMEIPVWSVRAAAGVRGAAGGRRVGTVRGVRGHSGPLGGPWENSTFLARFLSGPKPHLRRVGLGRPGVGM